MSSKNNFRGFEALESRAVPSGGVLHGVVQAISTGYHAASHYVSMQIASSNAKSSAGESFYSHTTKANGDRSLVYGEKGAPTHNHAVIDENGNIKYLREDGKVIADDSLQAEAVDQIMATGSFAIQVLFMI
jgi:hypothetical protein